MAACGTWDSATCSWPPRVQASPPEDEQERDRSPEESRLFVLDDIGEAQRRYGRFYIEVALEGRYPGHIVSYVRLSREEALDRLNAKVADNGRRFVEDWLVSRRGLPL